MQKNFLRYATLGLVFAGIAIGCTPTKNPQPESTPTPVAAVAADPKNCTYSVDGKNITLANGSAETTIDDTQAKLITRYFGNEVAGDFNGDGTPDVAFLLTQDAGGSGTFYYVAVALGGTKCQGTNAVLLGDRIAPQSSEFRDGQIIVNFADRKPGEPMTAKPSVGVSKYFRVENSQLAEVRQ
ncbi:MAG: hypothetical protein PHI63_03410 [Patescibacteria group bacterium]|nr:hypothetical protein [Patescibacteria group bacterium]